MAYHKKAVDSKQRVERDGYDHNLIPGETAARIEREGEGYKHQAEEAGFTVDNEGLANNYAVEPEMYYEERGDLRAKEEAQVVERAKELVDINDNEEDGKLTMEDDKRGKGVGFI